MGTIMQKLEKLLDTKEAIRQAIIAKGQTLPESAAFSAYPGKIAAITTGVDTSDATAVARDIVSGVTAYVGGEKLTGTMTTPGVNVKITGGTITDYDNENFRAYAPATATRVCLNKGVRVDTIIPKSGFGNADPSDVRDGVEFTSANGIGLTGTMAEAAVSTPNITVSSGGLITASVTQDAGYTGGGIKSATKQLTTKGSQIITPGATDITIAAGTYLTGRQTIEGDPRLVAENIKKGVSIFGVAGTAEAPQIPTIRLINASDVDWYVRYYSVETGSLVKMTIPSGAEKTIRAFGGFLVYYGLLNEVSKTGQWEGNAEELLDETTLSNHTGNKFYLAAVEQVTEITLKIVKSGGIGIVG